MKELDSWPQTQRPSTYGFERCQPDRIYLLEHGKDFTTGHTAVVKAVKRFATSNNLDAETRIERSYARDGKPGDVKGIAFRFSNRRSTPAAAPVAASAPDPVA